MTTTNPIEFTAAAQSYTQACRILAIVWVGTTTAGDTVDLRFRGEKAGRLWKGQASDTNTYLGISFGTAGLAAPSGFTVNAISSGTLLVYLQEL